jgi:hypothetical protein
MHKVGKCTWDLATQTVTSPHAQSEMAAVVEFENQDWVRDILQTTSTCNKGKTYANLNVAFPFQDDFLVGTIHGANAGVNKCTLHQVGSEQTNSEGAIKILDNENDDNVSILTSKTQDELVALLVQARKQLSNSTVGSRAASGSNILPGSSPVATQFHANVGGQEPTLANGVSSGTKGNNVGGNACNGLSSK